MSLKRIYFDQEAKMCLTCMYIDEYACNVADEGEVPHGYDGTAYCCKHDLELPESSTNRYFISPMWNACPKYKRCAEAQVNYEEIYNEDKGLIPNPNSINKIK